MSTIKIGGVDVVKECITHVSEIRHFTDSHSRILGGTFSVFVTNGKEIIYSKVAEGNIADTDLNIALQVQRKVNNYLFDLQEMREHIIEMLNKKFNKK